MKKLILSIFITFCVTIAYADNTVNLRADQITFSDSTVQVSSPVANITDHKLLTSTGTQTHATIDSRLDQDVSIGAAPVLDGTNFTNVDSFTNSGWEQYFSTWSTLGVQNSTNSYTMGYSSANAFYGDGSNLTGISSANTQNEPLYQIIVATYSGTGIDYGCTGTDDDVCINAAIVEANGIGVVFIKGGTYVLTSTITVNVANTNIVSQNAIFTWDASVTTDMNMVQISSANVIIDGLTLSGAGDDNWEQGFFFITGGNYGTLKTCLVKDVTTGEAVYKTWGTNTKIVNCIADNCDGERSLYVAATLAYINGFTVLNSASYISSTNTNGSFYNIVVYNSGDNTKSVNFTSDKNIFSGFIIKYADGIGIRNTGDFNCFSNGTMDDVDNAGVFLAGDGNTVTGINFRVIGTAGGNAQNGIDVIAGSNDTTLSNLTFSSTVDKYVIEVSATATNTKISNISFNEITGNIGTIVDLSGVSSIVNCYPVPNQLQSNTTCYRNLTVNGYIQFKSSTTAGLQGTTPTALGQTYWNTDTNELWISTGTSINDFIQK